MKYISEVTDLTGKTVVLRSDLNAESDKDSLKLRESVPTIKHLMDIGAKVVVMSHRGRPKNGPDPKLSMEFAMPFFKEFVSKGTQFLPTFDFKKNRALIDGSPAKSVFILENVRFNPSEDLEDMEFAEGMASMGDVYVYDAFASWRPGASVTTVPKLLPSYAGLLVEKEVKHLSQVMNTPKQPLVVIIGGGGKAIDKFDMIRHLHDRAGAFLIGGVLGNTFLKARGKDINGSIMEESLVESAKQFNGDVKIHIPHDWVLGDKGKICDLGPDSAKEYADVIKTAGTIIWNGPVGIFEDARYRAGSLTIANAIMKSRAFSVVGGGETTQLILQAKLEKKFGFLSTGGGAMLAYLAGKTMPALEALN